MSWTPHDLPHQQAIAARTLGDVADLWDHPGMQAQEKSPGQTAAAIRDYGHWLGTAPLTWLDDDVSRLVAGTMGTVPEWSPAATIPGDHGLIAYEHAPATLMWEGGVDGQWRSVAVDGIMWHPRGPGAVTVRALSRLDGARQWLSPPRQGIPFDELKALTFRVDSTLGGGVQVHTARSGDYVGPLRDADVLASLVGATWLLMSQPAVVEEGEPVSARVKSRPRGGGSGRVDVRVSTRRLSRTITGGTRKRGKATSRWWVRGHWRQQAWGKGRALRKPVFIAPHTAGAADGEVDSRPQVQVWRE